MRASTKTLLAIISICGCATASARELLALGPLEEIDARTSQVTVLGQNYRVDSLGEDVSVGDYVAVSGNLSEEDTAIVGKQRESYVAGASPVYLKGAITSYARDVGELNIGNTKVDYTPTLATAEDTDFVGGEVVEVSGIQPSLNGIVIASATVRDSLRDDADSGVARQAGIGFGVSRDAGIGFGVARQAGIGFGVSRDAGIGFGVARQAGIGFGVSRNAGIGFGSLGVYR